MPALTRHRSVIHHAERYTQAQRDHALKLFAQTQNFSDTSKQTGVPVGTIAYWLEQSARTEHIENPTLLALKFERGANKFLDMAFKVAKKASFGQLMTASAIATDKMLLLRGQPTSITANESLDARAVLTLLRDTLRAEAEAKAKAIDVTPEP